MIRRVLYIGIIISVIFGCTRQVIDFQDIDEPTDIIPDYSTLTIPPNIAPLNFFIQEEGDEFRAEISSKNGKTIVIENKTSEIQIPINKWKRLLSENKGEVLFVKIFVRKKGTWYKYKTISNEIAQESIHPYLAYRLLNTQFFYSANMKIAQRNLETFEESVIFDNKSTNNACLNCHSFSNYNQDKLSIHFRRSHGGTLIKDGDRLIKLNTKTQNTISAFGYVSWNPNGELIAYSVNKFNEFYTNNSSNLIEVTDQVSDIVVYNVKTNTVTTSPKISTSSRENFPTWSPDGKFLYYLSADEAFQDFNSRFYSHYSLVRIEYNQLENSWGETDTLYNARETGKSLTFPRISPDGKSILFCLINFGYFSIHHEESDLYLMDIESRQYKKLDINSDYSESYHSWSEDGRWVVFSSKRYNHIYTAPYFVYVDDEGEFHKPFILPQKDPHFYETFLTNYNIPEFINGKVKLRPNQIRNLLYKDGMDVIFDETVDTDALYYNQKDLKE